MTETLDPRTKLIVIFFISTLGLLFTDIIMLTVVFLIGFAVSKTFKADFFIFVKRLRKIIYLFFGIIVIQSIFVKSGDVIIGLGNIKLLTDVGLKRGLGYVYRVMIIVISGSIIATCDMRKIIQGLIDLKLPYDIAFMTSLGIKFLPLLVEEIKDTFVAIQLRGIKINKLPFKKRLEI